MIKPFLTTMFSRILTGTLLLFTLAASATAADIPSEVTLFKNVNVFDGKSEKLLKGYDVLVVGNLIKQVAKNIPSSGTYEMDVKTGGYKSVQMPGLEDNYASGYTVLTYEEEKTVKQQVPVTIIDGGGRTLTPGFIDTHIHLTLVGGGCL
jgi:hypothetical protein